MDIYSLIHYVSIFVPSLAIPSNILSQAAGVPTDTLFDWFQRGVLITMVVGFIGGWIAPKPTIDDMKAQRDKATSQRDEVMEIMMEMKNTLATAASNNKQVIELMRDILRKLPSIDKDGNDNYNKPAPPHKRTPRSSGSDGG
jgi:hypothetical protein